MRGSSASAASAKRMMCRVPAAALLVSIAPEASSAVQTKMPPPMDSILRTLRWIAALFASLRTG